MDAYSALLEIGSIDMSVYMWTPSRSITILNRQIAHSYSKLRLILNYC